MTQGRQGSPSEPGRDVRRVSGSGAVGKRVVTVFGGTGFLGRAIVRRLSEAGLGVRVAARNPRAVSFPATTAALEYHQVDLRDEAAVAAALQGADAAVNAVSLYVESRDRSFNAIHADGAERVARLAAKAGVTTLIHISGIGSDAASSSAYVRARARGEQIVRATFPEAIILRPSVMFGPGDAFLRAMDNVARLPLIPLFGDGRMKLQPVHVEDVAAAVERALDTPTAGGTIFELGGARVYTYREIVQAVLDHTGRRRLRLPVPLPVWRLLAALASALPNPPLTRDQVILMQTDNVVGQSVGTFKDLGVEPRDLESELASRGGHRR